MGKPTRASVAIDRRGAADDEELFRLYEQAFSADLAGSSRERWRWQYLANPQTSADGPEIWVAREGDRLLGQYASMPVQLWWGEAEVRSSWGMDVFLREEARGLGLGARLFTAWSDHVPVALGLGLTPSSYGLFKKLGYHDVGPVPFFQKIVDPVAMATRRLGPLLGSIVGRGLRPFLKTREAAATDVETRSITGFSVEYDTLWQEAREGYAMCVRRDAAYLNWKYASCPTHDYDITEARRKNALCGYAVSRHGPYRGLGLGWIVDVFTRANDVACREALLARVLDQFRAGGVARAQAFSMNASLAASLRRFGFFGRRSPMQFCVKSQAPAERVLAARDDWHVVFGDSDMDR